MLWWAIIQQMAALAERFDVAVPWPAVPWVVVEVGCGQHHLVVRGSVSSLRVGQGNLATFAIAPDPLRLVPPAAIAEMPDGGAMRPATDLATPPGPHEPDPVADLRPVDVIERGEMHGGRYGLEACTQCG
jgi:hypothetical protein